jgi:hypothetical protein
LERARGLVLVQTELEVHAHDRKVVAGPREDEVEGLRRLSLARCWPGRADLLEHLAGAFEDAEDRLGVAEDVARAHETSHGTLDAEDRDFGADRGARALAV